MTRMKKNELYDELCGILTDFEESNFFKSGEYNNETYQLYHELVKIQNNWEELTGDDE